MVLLLSEKNRKINIEKINKNTYKCNSIFNFLSKDMSSMPTFLNTLTPSVFPKLNELILLECDSMAVPSCYLST